MDILKDWIGSDDEKKERRSRNSRDQEKEGNRSKQSQKAGRSKRAEPKELPPSRPAKEVSRNESYGSDDLPTFKRSKSRAVVLPSGLIIESESSGTIHTSTLSPHSSDSFNKPQKNGFFDGLLNKGDKNADTEDGIPRNKEKDSTIYGIVRKAGGSKLAKTMSMKRTATSHTILNNSSGLPPQLTLNERRMIRNARLADETEPKSLPFFTRLWYEIRIAITLSIRKIYEGIRDITVWGRSIKRIEGDLGSGVSTYFRVLRWLLKINILMLILGVGLIIIPGFYINAEYDSSLPTTLYNKADKVCLNPDFFNSSTNSGKAGNALLQFLTGQGWMESTSMFAGWYPSANITKNNETTYNFPLAYFMVSIAYFLLALMFIAKNIARLFKKTAVESIETKVYSALVLNGWDHTISKKSTGQIKSATIMKSLREELFNDAQKYLERTSKDKILILLLRIGTNLVCVGAMVGTVFLYVNQILTDSSESHANETDRCGNKVSDQINITNIQDVNFDLIQQELAKFWKSYSASIIVSVSNVIFPIFFQVIGNLERYKFQSTRIGITMFRSFVMKLFSVCTYLYILYQATKPSAGLSEPWQTSNNTLVFNCWENYIGAQLYQLCIIDFIVFSINLLLSEYLRGFLVTHVAWIQKRLEKPEFNISNEILDLCYKQMIFWSSLFFSPLMLITAVIETVVIFYFKKVSALHNVLPPKQVVLTSQSSTIVNVVFLVSLLFVFVFVGLVIFRFTPSSTCGPFRGLEDFSTPFNYMIDNSGIFNTYIVENVKTTSIIITIIILITLIIYYYKSLANSREVSIKLLREQVRVEKTDKAYLIELTRSQLTGKPMTEVKRSAGHALSESTNNDGAKRKKIRVLHRYANPNMDVL